MTKTKKKHNKRYPVRRCFYCGIIKRRYITVDHLLPLSRGGSDAPANKVYACADCNTEKGSLSLEEYRLFKELDTMRFWTQTKGFPYAILFIGEINSADFWLNGVVAENYISEEILEPQLVWQIQRYCQGEHHAR